MSYYSGAKRNRERWNNDGNGGGRNDTWNSHGARRNRERWETGQPKTHALIPAPTFAVQNKTRKQNPPATNTGGGDGGGGDGGFGGQPILPSGSGDVYMYDPTVMSLTKAETAGFDNNDTDPATRLCPGYSTPAWPINESLTFANVQAAYEPVIAEVNLMRQAQGLPDIIWDNYLVLSSFRHATFLAERWIEFGYGFTTPPDLSPHMEPPDVGWGTGFSQRVQGTGRVGIAPAGAASGEGIGWNGKTPMHGLCGQRSDYNTPESCGHWCPFIAGSNVTHMGVGFDIALEGPFAGTLITVYNYANSAPDPTSAPLDKEIYEYLPKFAYTAP